MRKHRHNHGAETKDLVVRFPGVLEFKLGAGGVREHEELICGAPGAYIMRDAYMRCAERI